MTLWGQSQTKNSLSIRLSGCLVSDKGCECLEAAYQTNTHLRDLDLSYNHTGEAGIRLHSALRESPQGRLK